MREKINQFLSVATDLTDELTQTNPFVSQDLFWRISVFEPLSTATTAGLGLRSSFSKQIARFLPKNERMSDSLKRTSDSLIGSFLVSDLSDSLMTTHFLWATWANRSWSLIIGERPERRAHHSYFGEQPERFPHIAHQKRGNERIAHFFYAYNTW